MNIVSRSELQTMTGWALSTIDARVKRGMPYLEKPDIAAGTKQWRFDSVSVIEWAVAEYGAAEKTDPFKDASLREKVAMAGLKEIELSERQKVMMDIYDILPMWEEALGVFKSSLLAMPGRFAQLLANESDPAEVSRVIKREVNAILKQMNEGMQALQALAPPTKPGDSVE